MTVNHVMIGKCQLCHDSEQRSGTPGSEAPDNIKPATRAIGEHPTASYFNGRPFVVFVTLPPAFAGWEILFLLSTWGYAALHPRLSAFACSAGFQSDVSILIALYFLIFARC
jgi:hypothetical protein